MLPRLSLSLRSGLSARIVSRALVPAVQPYGRRYLSNTRKTLSDAAATQPPQTVSKTHPETYLDTLNTQELLGYGVIGLCTLSKLTLDLAIKMFPYTPLWLIRLLVYKNYCGGATLSDMMKTGERLSKRGIRNMMVSFTLEACDGKQMSVSVDGIIEMTKKSISDLLVPHTVKMIEEVGVDRINEVPPGYVALKPTALIDDAADILYHYQDPGYAARYQQLLQNCTDIAEVAEQANLKLHKQYPTRKAPFIVVIMDAERNDLQQAVYKLQRDLYARFNKEEAMVVGTMQMYLKESTPNLVKEDELARDGGYKLGWKLVRGAYIHSEPNRSVIYSTQAETDVNYNDGIKHIMERMAGDNATVGHLVVASHNEESQRRATDLLDKVGDPAVKANVVLGQLLGMGDNTTYYLTKERHVTNIIKYVPYGPPIETKDYLLRRLEENGDAVRKESGWPLVKGVFSTLARRVF